MNVYVFLSVEVWNEQSHQLRTANSTGSSKADNNFFIQNEPFRRSTDKTDCVSYRLQLTSCICISRDDLLNIELFYISQYDTGGTALHFFPKELTCL